MLHISAKQESIMDIFWKCDTPLAYEEVLERSRYGRFVTKILFLLLKRRSIIYYARHRKVGNKKRKAYRAAITQEQFQHYAIAVKNIHGLHSPIGSAAHTCFGFGPFSDDFLDELQEIIDDYIGNEEE